MEDILEALNEVAQTTNLEASLGYILLVSESDLAEGPHDMLREMRMISCEMCMICCGLLRAR